MFRQIAAEMGTTPGVAAEPRASYLNAAFVIRLRRNLN
jgi:hypothetical protein